MNHTNWRKFTESASNDEFYTILVDIYFIDVYTVRRVGNSIRYFNSIFSQLEVNHAGDVETASCQNYMYCEDGCFLQQQNSFLA